MLDPSWMLVDTFWWVFRRTLQYVTLALWHEPSVCRLFVTTLVHAIQRVELFGNIFASSNSPWTRTLCLKLLGKNRRGSWGSCKLDTRGMKIGVFRPISRFNSKMVQHAANYNLKLYSSLPLSTTCRLRAVLQVVVGSRSLPRRHFC